MIKETTPLQINAAITELCKLTAPFSKPEYIPVHPEPWALPSECFPNVKQMVNIHGGRCINGWAVWQWGNILIETEAHAVWQSPLGDLIDITPHSYNENQILFLADETICYTGTPIRSYRQALTNSPLVSELIQLYTKRDEIMCSTPGKQYSLPANMVRRIQSIQYLLHQKAERNDPCPCGSGLKYKKCCGRYE